MSTRASRWSWRLASMRWSTPSTCMSTSVIRKRASIWRTVSFTSLLSDWRAAKAFSHASRIGAAGKGTGAARGGRGAPGARRRASPPPRRSGPTRRPTPPEL
eukprot:scaffold213217_cov27-Tisochrysis_lutea.AAC.2